MDLMIFSGCPSGVGRLDAGVGAHEITRWPKIVITDKMVRPIKVNTPGSGQIDDSKKAAVCAVMILIDKERLDTFF